jgi:hypothetical protein
MTTTTALEIYPMLVSELPPPATPKPSRLTDRRQLRRFERALRQATGQERTDLIAQLRAQRMVTRTFT